MSINFIAIKNFKSKKKLKLAVKMHNSQNACKEVRIECEPEATKEPKLRLEIKPLIAIGTVL